MANKIFSYEDVKGQAFNHFTPEIPASWTIITSLAREYPDNITAITAALNIGYYIGLQTADAEREDL